MCFYLSKLNDAPSPIENTKTGTPEEKSFTFQPRILLNIYHLTKFQSHVSYFVRDHNMYLQTESTGESNVYICSPSSLSSAEQMKSTDAPASGGCSSPSATSICTAFNITWVRWWGGVLYSMNLTRGAGKHVTLSWLDTSEKHWC